MSRYMSTYLPTYLPIYLPLYRGVSRDYVPLGHAMNTVAFALCAGQVTGVFPSVAHGFMWLLTAGAYQLLAGVVAVRRSDPYNGFYFFLHSMFWIANGFNFCLEYVTGAAAPPMLAVAVIFFVTFFFVAVASLFRELYQFLQNLALCLLAVAFFVDGSSGGFFRCFGGVLRGGWGLDFGLFLFFVFLVFGFEVFGFWFWFWVGVVWMVVVVVVVGCGGDGGGGRCGGGGGGAFVVINDSGLVGYTPDF